MKILFKIIDYIFLVKEIKSKDGNLHFKRWSLVTSSKFINTFFDTYLFNVYIHLINRADEDLDMHDHPWDFVSIILKGGYNELTKDGLSFRVPFTASCKKAEELHKVTKLFKPTYSLVLTSRRKRDWGFQTSEDWFNNIQYRNRKNGTKV